MLKHLIMAAALAMPTLSSALAADAPAKAPTGDAPVYYVIYQDVHDEARFKAYVEAVTPAITQRGGVLIAAGAPSYTEGQLPFHRLVVFRWPSRQVLESFIASEEYRARIRPHRIGAADWVSAIVPALQLEAGK